MKNTVTLNRTPEVERKLMPFLVKSKARKGICLTVFSLLMEDELQMLEMCEFLSRNPEATGEEILAKAEEISGE